MNKTNHPKFLTIFFWIFSVFQTFVLLIYAVYLGFMGYIASGAGFQDGNSFAKEEATFLTVFLVFFVIMLLLGIVSVFINIFAGFGLWKNKIWARKMGVIASIFSIISFIYGGILLLPFGVALGIYGLWFFLGETGKECYQDGELQFNRPPSPPRSWE